MRFYLVGDDLCGVSNRAFSFKTLNEDEFKMEAFGILGFVFGLVAFARLQKLTKTLMEKGVIEDSYQDA